MSPWLSTTVNTESTKEGLKRLLDSDTLDANFDRGLTAVSHQITTWAQPCPNGSGHW